MEEEPGHGRRTWTWKKNLDVEEEPKTWKKNLDVEEEPGHGRRTKDMEEEPGCGRRTKDMEEEPKKNLDVEEEPGRGRGTWTWKKNLDVEEEPGLGRRTWTWKKNLDVEEEPKTWKKNLDVEEEPKTWKKNLDAFPSELLATLKALTYSAAPMRLAPWVTMPVRRMVFCMLTCGQRERRQPPGSRSSASRFQCLGSPTSIQGFLSWADAVQALARPWLLSRANSGPQR
ncbi:hypothetical protein EYF80_065663 [Liparis tanakae]|uniref:Uncharacterized protein n=1 Tax=Liparis tanakae TaxID=230148 RepID=A0A4Z2E614_9TELE|nr:hypothetical protein EYF80_065663 [Liparis tanakae]